MYYIIIFLWSLARDQTLKGVSSRVILKLKIHYKYMISSMDNSQLKILNFTYSVSVKVNNVNTALEGFQTCSNFVKMYGFEMFIIIWICMTKFS